VRGKQKVGVARSFKLIAPKGRSVPQFELGKKDGLGRKKAQTRGGSVQIGGIRERGYLTLCGLSLGAEENW